jgi:trk system potassium uptake protein TrkH
VNLRLDAQIVGFLVGSLGAFQLLPAVVALLYGESPWPFLVSGLAAAAFGLALALPARPRERLLRPRDAYLVVAAGWAVGSAFGGLPYLLAGMLGPVDAFFESVAGFTTTGSTVMPRIEGSGHGLLLWRSFTQWIGGMGIILFTVAILPLLGIGGMQLFRVEVPGPVKDKLSPRVVETARRLWAIYVGLTAAQWLALWLAGLSHFDAACHAFTTLATGGFSTRDASVGAFGSPAVEWIVTVFMIAAGTNFVLHHRLVTQGPRGLWRDAELRYYLAVIALATLACWLFAGQGGIDTGAGAGAGAGVAGAAGPGAVDAGAVSAGTDAGLAGLRGTLFSVVSVVTTTGYGTVDFERWPPFGQLVLLQLMILGGMSGSTAGGVKSLRVLLGFRALGAAVQKLVHPRAVRPVKYGGRAVPEDVVAGIWAFFTAYFAIGAAATAVVAAWGYDLVTAVSAALTTLGNVGPGLGAVGPFDNFAHVPAAVKLVLSACMIAGRLEVFTLLVLLQPSFWRR